MAVNITFREEIFYKRWRLLAADFGCDVLLVGPKYYEYHRFGEAITFTPSEITETKFSVRHIDMQAKKWLRNDWWSWKYLKLLIRSKPDIIYLIGYETRNIVLISILYKLLFDRKAKIVMFSMRGIDMPLYGLEYRLRWSVLKRHINFINVHYPHARDLFRYQGKYKGVINLQTQIGVDKDVYFPSTSYRMAVRNKYGIGKDEFVFGAAARMEAAKGIFDIIDACERLNYPFKFLLLGDGQDFQLIEKQVRKRNLGDRIFLTGRVPAGSQVAMHLNAMDCFVHVPRTTRDWVDTFPLVVVQAMACALPVIGSDSGAVPYQIGYQDMIVPEGDVNSLSQKMERLMKNPVEREHIGREMFRRVLNSFEIRHLNKCLLQSFNAAVSGDAVNTALDQN